MQSKILTGEKTKCYHCGDTCVSGSVEFQDKIFCCYGCKSVFELLQSCDLEEYYDRDEAHLTRLAPTRSHHGDGLNDATALTESDFGISVADDVFRFAPASDAILAADSFQDLDKLFAYSRRVIKIVKYSFALSFTYNDVGLFFAAQGLLTPVMAAILMPISSVSVVAFVSIGMGVSYSKTFMHEPVTEDYYQKELHCQEHIDAKQNLLNTPFTINTRAVTGTVLVTIDGLPECSGVHGRVTLCKPDNQAFDQSIDLLLTERNRMVIEPKMQWGRYRVEVSVEIDGKPYISKRQVVL